MIKLIAIDTDGTLLNSQGKIQASTKEAISEALRNFRRRARPLPRLALSAARSFWTE